MLKFGSWLPDLPNYGGGGEPGVTTANNVVPHFESYRPFLQFARYSDDGHIPGTVYGAFSCISGAGTVFNFAGTATKLYMASTDGLTWIDVTRAVGGNYTLVSGKSWSFSQFNDVVFAQNGFDVAQVFTLDVSAKFINNANVPVASFTATVRGFSVIANTPVQGKEVRWSAVFDPLDWVSSDETMADSQLLPDGGDTSGLVGGEIGVIFQRRAITRMVFAGPPLSFSFDKISTTLGCHAPRSIAHYGDFIFFMAENGMHMLRGGQEVVPIGEGKIDRWLLSNLDQTNLVHMSAATDPARKLYLLGIPTHRDDGRADTLLIYHWPTGKWSTADFTHDMIMQAYTQSGYNLDTIDALNPNPPNTTGIDGMDFSFDSNVFSGGGALGLSAFNATHYNGFFIGPPLAATVETDDIQLVPQRKSLLLAARPIIEGAAVTMRLADYVHDQQQQPSTLAHASVAPNYKGLCPMRASGRYHRLSLGIEAGSDWEHAIGIDDLSFKPQSE